MKKAVIIAIILSMAMFSCDDILYIYVERNVSSSKALTFNVNTTGNINQTSILTISELVNTLVGDIKPGLQKYDYTIKELSIQSASLEIIQNPANTANTVNISSFVVDKTYSAAGKPILKETNLPINQASAFIVNSFLDFGGVETINKALDNAIKKIGSSHYLTFDIKGNPVPANSRVSGTIKINLTFNMRYSYCEESMFLVVSARDDNCIKL